MKLFFITLSLILSSLFASAAEIVVLVPGFFNSLNPEYFSQDIVNSFKNKGFKVYVVNNFNPIGTIEDNGTRLEAFLKAVELNEKHAVDFNLVAHSAGGFYSMWVANRQHFSIKNIYTVSTPYLGVEFIETWLADCTLFRAITDLAHLESLKELTPEGAKNFLATIRVSPNTKITAFGGYQSESIDITNARNLSAPLLVTSHFITKDSDGIVAFSSAIGLGNIKTTEEKTASQFLAKKYFIALEHWEQILDSSSFILLGIRNTGYIRNEQIRFYSGLADLLAKP
ncbi:MAG: hypothetical protein WA160_15215 [Pseudobdellovibrio sp.]